MKVWHVILIAIGLLIAWVIIKRQLAPSGFMVPQGTLAGNPNVATTKPGGQPGTLGQIAGGYDKLAQTATKGIASYYGVGFLSPTLNKISDYTNPTDPDFYKSGVGATVKNALGKLKFW